MKRRGTTSAHSRAEVETTETQSLENKKGVGQERKNRVWLTPENEKGEGATTRTTLQNTEFYPP